MVGKRKRAETAGESGGALPNGDKTVHRQNRFHDWLQDVLIVLKEYVYLR